MVKNVPFEINEQLQGKLGMRAEFLVFTICTKSVDGKTNPGGFRNA